MATGITGESVLHRALCNGLITADEARSKSFVDAARDVADETNESWPVDEGFGSSDMTPVMERCLRYAGVKTAYVHGRLTRVAS